MSQIPYSIATNAKNFLAGIVAEQASYYKDQVKAAKDINTFVTDIDKDLRAIYDKYIPNVHVIDVDHFTNVIAKKVSEAGKLVLDANSDTGIASRFSDPNSKEYLRLKRVIAGSLKRYHKKLLSTQGNNTNPILFLNTLSQRLFTRTSRINNTISARVMGSEFSKNINQVFGNKAVLAAIDSTLGSSDTRFVFFSSSFNAIGDPIRNNIYGPIKTYIRTVLGTDTISNFQVGALVNAGHAALISELGSFVNSPAFAQVLYGVGSGRSSRMSPAQAPEAAEIFKIESKILENNIVVTKEFLSAEKGYGVLLSLGVTFTNIEEAEANIRRGSSSEKTTVRSFDIKKPTQLQPAVKAKFVASLLRMIRPTLARSSRNILEFISDAVAGSIKGVPTKAEKTVTSVKDKKSVKVAVSKKPKLTKFANAKAPNIPLISLSTILDKLINLAGLQNLINSQLQHVISANMGNGNSTRVLNYRTGRLAASAKVDRLTQSREGMITAFYSYMRNPYGTFSEGGKQQNPKTRDPKLLISNSIREIAATKVANRLRAVAL